MLLALGLRARARVTLMSALDIEEIAPQVLAKLDGGASITQILDAMPDSAQIIVGAAMEALKATKFYYSKEEGGMVHEPDYKTRLDAAKFLASYRDGLPAQTTEIRLKKAEASADDVLKAARSSSAMRDALRTMLLETGEDSNS